VRVPLTIADFLDRAAIFGDQVAIVDEPGTAGSLGRLTFASLVRRARGMAATLDEMGIKVGERVAIVSPNSARFLISFFGTSAFGGVLVPINFRLTANEVNYIVAHSGARLLLLDPELDSALAGVEIEQRILLDGVDDASLFAESDAAPEPFQGDEDSTATVNYTSGTTARPKGVQLTHRNLWLNTVTMGLHLGISDRDVLLHTLPMFHCNGWGTPYIAAGMGARQVVLRKVDGEEILSRVETEGVTIMCGAPAVVTAVVAAAEARHAAGRPIPGGVRIVVAGAPPPSELIRRFEALLDWEFIQIYGLTETAPLATINRAPASWDDIDPVERSERLSRAGVPVVGARLRLAEDGEVCLRANHVFAGYWEQPAETDAAIRDGWFHTGDGGDMDGAHLVIRDRKKDVIISGGENVSSIEVEDCLYRHPDVADVAVIGVPDEKWGETVKALVVLREGATCAEQAIIDFTRERMAHFKCPTSVEFRTELPRTATGKLQKFVLRQPFWQGLERRVN
jgi:fatty-acyl-CoA synthase